MVISEHFGKECSSRLIGIRHVSGDAEFLFPLGVLGKKKKNRIQGSCDAAASVRSCDSREYKIFQARRMTRRKGKKTG